jgi:hypothetical protein
MGEQPCLSTLPDGSVLKSIEGLLGSLFMLLLSGAM